MREYWHKQKSSEPLYPDLLWSRPQNKRTAGKLLVIAGNAHGFAAAGEAFAEAQAAGIGTTRVLLPDVLQKVVGSHFETAEFAPSTPAGSLSQAALAAALEQAAWADATLIAGDLGRNSETAILMEKFLGKQDGTVILTKDAADYAINLTPGVLNREDTYLVISVAQLQKLFAAAKNPVPITFSMDLFHMVDALHAFTEKYRLGIVVKHLGTLFASVNGQVSTTPTELDNEESWRVKIAALASVWLLQNSSKAFEALTTSLLSESIEDS
jgi:hypothetical protein